MAHEIESKHERPAMNYWALYSIGQSVQALLFNTQEARTDWIVAQGSVIVLDISNTGEIVNCYQIE